jgi:hypothetical protein
LRKEGYDSIVKNIKPGMHRRQLYALLPPMRKPQAEPPRMWDFVGSLQYTEHVETHELDDECHLMVSYQLKDGSEYLTPSSLLAQRRAKKGHSLTPDSIDICPPIVVKPDGIDKLLKQLGIEAPKFKTGPVPSMENPDDIVTAISRTRFMTRTDIDSEDKISFLRVTSAPTQDATAFGREPSGPVRRR